MMPRPTFDQLPLNADDPAFSAWGLYGKGDELGTLNLLTPDVVAEAAKEIQSGVRVGLDLALNFLKRPSHNRQALKHNIIRYPRPNHDDHVDFNTQVSEIVRQLDITTQAKLKRSLPSGMDLDTSVTRSNVYFTMA